MRFILLQFTTILSSDRVQGKLFQPQCQAQIKASASTGLTDLAIISAKPLGKRSGRARGYGRFKLLVSVRF
ncbi:hypothetical protein DFH27DRAFT_550428 [Peziza echinospora]|nr:hypothetical protein DFH27DRAFT_550428 [Peziza echinospora]